MISYEALMRTKRLSGGVGNFVVIAVGNFMVDENNHAGTHNNLGNIYIEQEKYDLAIASFKEAIRIEPSYGLAYHNLARAYSLKNGTDLPLELLKIASELYPENATTHQ